jgi:hypothetical protein
MAEFALMQMRIERKEDGFAVEEERLSVRREECWILERACSRFLQVTAPFRFERGDGQACWIAEFRPDLAREIDPKERRLLREGLGLLRLAERGALVQVVDECESDLRSLKASFLDSGYLPDFFIELSRKEGYPIYERASISVETLEEF